MLTQGDFCAVLWMSQWCKFKQVQLWIACEGEFQHQENGECLDMSLSANRPWSWEFQRECLDMSLSGNRPWSWEFQRECLDLFSSGNRSWSWDEKVSAWICALTHHRPWSCTCLSKICNICNVCNFLRTYWFLELISSVTIFLFFLLTEMVLELINDLHL